MGCSSSSEPAPAPKAAPEPISVDAQELKTGVMVDGQVAPPAGKGKGKSKGKGKGKGEASRFQISLGGKWKDYGKDEDAVMKKAYMTGLKKCKFQLRGQHYEYDFKKMVQINKDTRKERKIRPPRGGPKPPAKPILPKGPMVIIAVKPGQPGTIIQVPNPNNPGSTVPVLVPPHAKPGSRMAVPLPAKGESTEALKAKQEEHDKEHGTKTSPSSWTTGGKLVAGGAAVAGVAAIGVGGVILGDHLAGGEMASTIGEAAVDAGEAIADAAEDAADAVADWAPGAAEDAGEWLTGAGEDIGDWAAGAGEDIGEWTAGAAEDVGDWLGDAAEDTGDFIMDLF